MALKLQQSEEKLFTIFRILLRRNLVVIIQTSKTKFRVDPNGMRMNQCKHESCFLWKTEKNWKLFLATQRERICFSNENYCWEIQVSTLYKGVYKESICKLFKEVIDISKNCWWIRCLRPLWIRNVSGLHLSLTFTFEADLGPKVVSILSKHTDCRNENI